MTFKRERELVDVLCRDSMGALDTLRANGHDSGRVLREVPVGAHTTRVPDVVVIYSRSRAQVATLRLTYADAIVLAAVLGTPCTAEEFCSRYFADAKAIELRLLRLAAKRVVRRREDRRYEVDPASFPRDLRVIAIEAKLSRWRRALVQAREYFVFANETYVAVPAAVATGLELLKECAAAGVGVIAVDAHGIRVVLEAETQTPLTPEWVRFVAGEVGCVVRPCEQKPVPPTPPASRVDDQFQFAD